MAGENDDDLEGFLNEDGDDTDSIIRKALADQGVTDDVDDAGLDQPPLDGEAEDATVSAEEGARLASKAAFDASKAAKPEAEADGDADGKAKTEGDAAPQPADLSSAAVDDLIKDVPEASRAEISRRLSEASASMAVFNKPYIADQMKRYGAKPADVVNRLTDLAAFATEKPDEYLAWAASEMASSPDKIGDVLGKAAALHGFKLVPADQGSDDDEDPFADEETKALKRELADLKRRLEGGGREFGPDTPDRVQTRTVQQELEHFVDERDEKGQPKRPHFNAVAPMVGLRAQQHVAQTGQRVTVQDLDRFYSEAVQEMRGMFGTSAAQPTQPVQDRGNQAAAVDKARRASSTIDGSGQGANRRPAPPSDDLEAVLAYAIAQQRG